MASSSELWVKGSSALPCEVVKEEILFRIPIEDVMGFKSTCKEWYGLLKEKRFIYKHLDLSHERFIRIYHDKVQIIDPVTLDLLSLPVPSEFLMCKTATSLDAITHCDGLLLCRCHNGISNHKQLAVWNPVLSSRVKWIEPSHPYKSYDEYGFGYDSDHKYKILRFENFARGSTEFEIYDLKSKLWRAFPAKFDWSLFLLTQNVSMKGNMYWIAQTKSKFELFIQSFDFSRETFKTISSSFPCKVEVDVASRKSLDILVLSGFGGDRLSLLHQPGVGEIKIDVWVTSKVNDALVSWTKYFNVTLPNLPRLHTNPCSQGSPTYFIHKTNGIMLWCDKLVQEEDDGYACACLYQIAECEIKKQVETGPPYRRSARAYPPWRCGCVYVPSLVPVPE